MDTNSETNQEFENEQEPQIEIDEHKLNQYREKIRMEQNLPMAIVSGLATALIGAILWAIITVSTGFQIGYMAIGVGFIVGYAVSFLGKGIDQVFGIIGALFALLGCLGGNALSIIGFAAIEFNMGYFEVLSRINVSLLTDAMAAGFSPIDLLFYGLAVYEGYHFAFRKISEEEVLEHVQKDAL